MLLIDGGFCHWHLRRDGQLTIREIISTRPGAGSEMLETLKAIPAHSIFAKCPLTWMQMSGIDGEDLSLSKQKRHVLVGS